MTNKSYKFMQYTSYLGIFLILACTLLPIHTNPIPTFYIEVISAAGLFVLCLNFYNRKDFALRLDNDIKPNDKHKIFPRIPNIAFMPVLLSLIIIYHIIIYNQYSSIVMLNSIAFAYCVCVFLAFCIGYNLKLKGFNLNTALSYIFLGIGIISSIIMILQALNLAVPINSFIYNLTKNLGKNFTVEYILSVPNEKINLRPYANINQPNHMVTFMAWSIISWIYIGINYINLKKNISLKQKYIYFIAGFLLCIGLVLPASRSIYLHMLTFAVVLSLYYKSSSKPKPIILISAFIFISIIAIIYFISFSKSAYHLNIATLIERNENTQIANSLRQTLRKHGWIMFMQNPMLGVSYGNFSWTQFINSPLAPNGEIANSSHNIVIDFLAKTGMIGFLICFIPILMWTINTLKSCLNNKNEYIQKSKQTFALGVVACLIGHGMLEYPQNYLFFVIPACLVIGYTSNKYIYFLKKSRIILSSLLIISIAYTTLITIDYAYISKNKNIYETKSAFILYPYSDTITIFNLLPEYMDSMFGRIHLSMADNAVHFLPSPTLIKNYIVLLAREGQIDKAFFVLNNILNFVDIKNKKEYASNIYNLTQNKLLTNDKNLKKFAGILKDKYKL